MELRGLFVSMCKSEMPMVRAAAFANLASFAQQMEEVHVEAELLPEFAKLAADDAESGAPSARLPTASPSSIRGGGWRASFFGEPPSLVLEHAWQTWSHALSK